MSTASSPATIIFDIDRARTARYFAASAYVMGAAFIFLWGLGLVFLLVYQLCFSFWLPLRQAEALKYQLDGSTLRLDQGVVFLARRSIPLDRITDVVLYQGPILRRCGLWQLHVQTAGTSWQRTVAMMNGLTDPEGTRDLILQARDEAVLRLRTQAFEA